jgi:tetratricopeptide (TPR) repeat protein
MPETHREEIAKLEALYAAHPEGRVFTHLAEAYRKSGDLERARQILEDGLARHADYSSAHVVLGRVRIDLGDTAGAADAFRRVLELDRHNLVALRTLGEINAGEGRLAEALRYYRDLVALDPTDDRLRITVSRLEAEVRGAPAATVTPPADTPIREEPVEELAAVLPEPKPPEPEPVEAVPPSEPEPVWAASPQIPDVPTFAVPEVVDSPTQVDEPSAPIDAGWSDLDILASQPTDEAAVEMHVAEASQLPELQVTESQWGQPEGFEGGEFVPPETTLPGLEGIESALPGMEGIESDASAAYDGPGVYPVIPDEAESAPADLSYGEAALPFWPEPEDDWHGVSQEPIETAPVGSIESTFAALETEKPEEFAALPPVEPADEQQAVVDLVAGAAPGASLGEADLATVTLAELYANQGIYDRAADVYRSLLSQVPEDERLRSALEHVEARVAAARAAETAPTSPEPSEQEGVWLETVESAWTGGDGVAGAEETPYAWADTTQHAEPAGPLVSEYFRSLLAWKPAHGAAHAGYGSEASAEAGYRSDEATIVATTEQGEEVILEAGAVEAAFEEWFGPEQEGRSAAGESDQEAGNAAEAADEADADLEMFRSWLQSLKK